VAGGILLALMAGAVACSPGSSAPSPSATASDPVASQDAGTGNLPPGCETINLRAPNGSTLDLEGEWLDVTRDDAATMTWFVRTEGDCFFGVGSVSQFTDYSNVFTVQEFNGTIRPDFTIDGAFVHVGPAAFSETTAVYVPAVLLIEFAEDGHPVIREDREPNVIGPRCPRPEVCTPPMELR
jgi:hypothetical protein